MGLDFSAPDVPLRAAKVQIEKFFWAVGNCNRQLKAVVDFVAETETMWDAIDTKEQNKNGKTCVPCSMKGVCIFRPLSCGCRLLPPSPYARVWRLRGSRSLKRGGCREPRGGNGVFGVFYALQSYIGEFMLMPKCIQFARSIRFKCDQTL